MDAWISKMCYIHTKEYYSSFQREEILTHATTWLNFGDIMPSETSQLQKDKMLHDATYMW